MHALTIWTGGIAIRYNDIIIYNIIKKTKQNKKEGEIKKKKKTKYK